MTPKEKQKIEIEKSHSDPLLSFNQAVTLACSDFLGTALIEKLKLQLPSQPPPRLVAQKQSHEIEVQTVR